MKLQSNFRSYRRSLVFAISFLLLLLAKSSKGGVFNQGRWMLVAAESTKGGEGKDVLTASAMVGSRPPRCARMCLKCAHCEAVQVPAIPQQIGAAAHTSMNIDARGDDKSNYKPMKWKCKCGNFLFNP